MTLITGIFLLTLVVITALAIVYTKNLFVAVMLSGVFSLLMAANFSDPRLARCGAHRGGRGGGHLYGAVPGLAIADCRV